MYGEKESGGYRGAALQILSDAGIAAGDTITISCRDNITHAGILMPRYEHDDDTHIVLKLNNGYNVGIDTHKIAHIEKEKVPEGVAAATGIIAAKRTGASSSSSSSSSSSGSNSSGSNSTAAKKRILLLSTGGTIASRVDYRTGAVTPALSADDLLDAVPELGRIAEVDAEVVISEYSENIMPEHWLLLARHIAKRAGYATADGGMAASGDDRGYAGVIVAHGTDTMHYTSAFLSFALAGFPVPIVLVGAQRSPDRASSDAATNLTGAARFITSCGKKGVYVAMHKGTGDDAIACHAGTRVRKNHTSKRDAFETVGGGDPAFVVSADGTITGSPDSGNNCGRAFFSDISYDPKRISLDQKVALIKYHPGYDPGLLKHMTDTGYRAIIFEGTGLGHVGKSMYEQVARAAENGIFLGMTSQCINGRTCMTVYESGRDLSNLGVVALGDMTPETALVKAMWAAGNAKDASGIRDIMLKETASEMTVRR